VSQKLRRLEFIVFEKQQRIYYEDTDAGGMVYHTNHLKFMERCRCDWLGSLGFDVAKLQQNNHIMFVVREANIKYKSPAKLFDNVTVSAKVLQVGKISLLLEQKIYNKDVLLCVATIKLATLHTTSFKLTPMPKMLYETLTAEGQRK